MSERVETLAPPEPSAPARSNGPVVLLVDDHVDFRDSLGLLVAREGFTVREAGSLSEARRELERTPADVVIVDLTLPDGNGIELYRERPPEEWPRDVSGNLQMMSARLDLDALRSA